MKHLDNQYRNIISRHIINPDMTLFQLDENAEKSAGYDYEKLCELIDYWKILLIEKYQASPGKTVLIEHNLINAYYFTAVFAALELGLILIIDYPHAYNEQDVHSYRMTMHGKIDLAMIHSGQMTPGHTLYRYWDLQRIVANCDQIVTEKDFEDYVITDHELFSTMAKKIFATPDSVAIWSASSGTTGLPKKIVINHHKTFRQAERLIPLLGFTGSDKSLHMTNLHHGASMCYHFLPSLMSATEHYVASKKVFESCPDLVKKHKISKIQLYHKSMVNNFLNVIGVLDHDLDIITLFSVTETEVQLLKEKNVKSIRVVFGDTTIGLGFFVKTIDQSTQIENYELDMVGTKLDDFFDLKVAEGMLWIAIPELGEDWKTSNDRFEIRDGKFYFHGRSNSYRFGPDWVVLADLEAKISEFFGDNNATIVIDPEQQQIYLAIWHHVPGGIEKLNHFFENQYEVIRLSKIADNLNYEEFLGSRKIDRQKLRDYFRLA